MNPINHSHPVRLIAFLGLLALVACGDDPDSNPADFTTPTRHGDIRIGQGTGLEPISQLEVAPDGTIFAGQDRGGIRRFDVNGLAVQALPIDLSYWNSHFAVSRDRIFVLDPDAKRIAVFDWLGAPINEFAFEAAELFDGFPDFDLAVTPDNILYLLDPRLRRVQKLTATGQVLAVWGERGIGPGQMEYPRNINVDSRGRVLVLDVDLWRVQRYSGTGQLDRTWDLVRTIEFGAWLEGDFAVDAHDQPVILETPTFPFRVVTLEADGPGATTWLVAPDEDSPDRPEAVAVLPDDDRLLAVPYRGVLERYAPDWTKLGDVGHPFGAWPGELLLISEVGVLDSERLFVWDDHRGEINTFNLMGGDPMEFPLPPDLKKRVSRPRSAGDGRLWFGLGFGNAFRLIDSSGRLLAGWEFPVGDQPDGYVVDYEALADGELALLIQRDGRASTVELHAMNGTLLRSFTLPDPRGTSRSSKLAYIDLTIDRFGNARVLSTDDTIRQANLLLGRGDVDDWSLLQSDDIVFPTAIDGDDLGNLHVVDVGRGAVVVLDLLGHEVGSYGHEDIPTVSGLEGPRFRSSLSVGEDGLAIFSLDSRIAPIYRP